MIEKNKRLSIPFTMFVTIKVYLKQGLAPDIVWKAGKELHSCFVSMHLADNLVLRSCDLYMDRNCVEMEIYMSECVTVEAVYAESGECIRAQCADPAKLYTKEDITGWIGDAAERCSIDCLVKKIEAEESATKIPDEKYITETFVNACRIEQRAG